MGPGIGIDQKKLAAVTKILSVVLADEFLLYTKTRNAHWNVEGADFYAKHTFFEKQYEQLDETMDDVAERIRELGHYAPATLKQFLGLTRLTEISRAKNDSHGFMKELLADHESIIIHLRENINPIASEFSDIGTSDFLTALLETHEKMAWMLRAHLTE
jgi:starvation-inducible DNA-binding protein